MIVLIYELINWENGAERDKTEAGWLSAVVDKGCISRQKLCRSWLHLAPGVFLHATVKWSENARFIVKRPIIWDILKEVLVAMKEFILWTMRHYQL